MNPGENAARPFRRFLGVLGPLALAPLSLTALPAAAQTLDLIEGSALIVHDNTGSGTFLNSTNYAFGGGAGPATYQYDKITDLNGYGINVNVTLATGSSVKTATVYGNVNVSGGTAGTLENDGIGLVGLPNGATTNVTAGSVGDLRNGNTVNISGGTVNTLETLPVSSGETETNISGGTVGTANGSLLTSVSGGTITALSVGGYQSINSLSVSAGTITTLNINGGRADITGGNIGTLNASVPASYGVTQFTLSGGTVGTLNNLAAPYSFDTVALTGGSVGTFNNAAYLKATGGSIAALDNSGFAELDPGVSVTAGTNEAKGQETILGGSLGALTNYGTAELRNGGGSLGTLTNYGTFTADDPNTPTGGTLTSLVERGGVASLYAGNFSFLDNFTGGTLDVFGYNLVLAGGFLTGTLADGQLLDAAYKDDGGTLNLLPAPAVPEASTTVSLGLLLALGLGGVTLAARRRQV